MKKQLLITWLLLSIFATLQAQTAWHNPMDAAIPNIMGRGWNAEIGKVYHRLPARAKDNVREPLWNLAKNSAGLYIKFVTNAKEIKVKYHVENKTLQLFNVPTLGMSGIDLYATDAQGSQLLCTCFGSMGAKGQHLQFNYNNLQYKKGENTREYQLFLPLYNTVDTLQIGVPEGSIFAFSKPETQQPIVMYGTSILQGASASRPAMAWTNIVQRSLGIPVYNLGFSGNGLMEKELFEYMSETNAQIYVIDCLPNMESLVNELDNRLIQGINILRSKSNAPIVLIENAGYMNMFTNPTNQRAAEKSNAQLRKSYQKLKKMGYKNLHYITTNDINMPMDGQVDGVHANDIGMQHYANAFLKKAKKLLK